MGVAQNAMMGLVSTASVGATMLSRNLGKGNQALAKQNPISEANDADKAAQMAQKALMNAEKLKGLKLDNKAKRLQNRMLKLDLKKKKEEMKQFEGGKK